eukprot:SAG25_NODE_11843_length_293_cov_61.907216_1_plen_97_part_11
MNALNQAVLRSQTEISLHAVTANRIVLAGPPRRSTVVLGCNAPKDPEGAHFRPNRTQFCCSDALVGRDQMQLATADPAAPAFWRRDQELNPFWPKIC